MIKLRWWFFHNLWYYANDVMELLLLGHTYSIIPFFPKETISTTWIIWNKQGCFHDALHSTLCHLLFIPSFLIYLEHICQCHPSHACLSFSQTLDAFFFSIPDILNPVTHLDLLPPYWQRNYKGYLLIYEMNFLIDFMVRYLDHGAWNAEGS
jgi:hypothetical protein